MGMKTFYVVRDMKHPLYRSRMLRAGDSLDLNGPDARLYRRLGVITEERPASAAAPAAAEPKAAEPKAAKPKAAPKKRKRTTRKTSAKK